MISLGKKYSTNWISTVLCMPEDIRQKTYPGCDYDQPTGLSDEQNEEEMKKEAFFCFFGGAPVFTYTLDVTSWIPAGLFSLQHRAFGLLIQTHKGH